MDNSQNTIALIKSDTLVILILVTWIVMIAGSLFIVNTIFEYGRRQGVTEEKVGALEDVVFVYGLYKDIANENKNSLPSLR